jgi:hypothetical protein
MTKYHVTYRTVEPVITEGILTADDTADALQLMEEGLKPSDGELLELIELNEKNERVEVVYSNKNNKKEVN